MIKKCVSQDSVLNFLTTLQALAPIMYKAGVDLDAPDSALPGPRTWGWRRCARAARPVWVMMAWYLWQLWGHTTCPHMDLMLLPMNQSLYAMQRKLTHLIFHFTLFTLLSITVSHHPALWNLFLLGTTGVMGNGQLCQPGKMRVASPSFDPISTYSPVTFHTIARWSTIVTHVPMPCPNWHRQYAAFKLSQVQIALNLMTHVANEDNEDWNACCLWVPNTRGSTVPRSVVKTQMVRWSM